MNLSSWGRPKMKCKRPASTCAALGATIVLVGLLGCGRSAGDGVGQPNVPPAQGPDRTTVAAQPAASAAPLPTGFVLLVVEDKAGRVRISSGQIGEIARLSPLERRAVQGTWQATAAAARAGLYCARLVDPQGRAAAHRCVAPRTTVHLAPRDANSPAAAAELDVVAFAVRLPWPATATGGGWQLMVHTPDGRSASWRPRE